MIDAKIEAQKLLDMYKEDERQRHFRMLLTGESGSGKTFIARTCRRPVHIDEFDSGGTVCLRKYINEGWIIPDTKYEKEDPFEPSAYERWKTEFDYRYANGYFESIGTYFLDSASTWAEAIMNWVLKNASRPGKVPQRNKDYMPQKIEIRNYIGKIMTLPCDVIVTGHLKRFVVWSRTDPKTGDVTEESEFRFISVGDGAILIPLKFDEIWVTKPSDSSSGVKYEILTQSTGKYLARSRLSADGLLNKYEEPDIKAILKKANFETTDKVF